MKNLLYIGNALSLKGKTVTTIDILSESLKIEGYTVKVTSRKKNKLLRLLDMLFSIVSNRKKTDYVLIDTYSTQNFYFAYLSARFCSFFKLKYIPILHGGNLPERLKKSPNKSRFLFGNALVNIAPSNYTKSNFKAKGYTNVLCIPNSIEIENYPFKKKRYDTINLLWVRSFSSLYNPNLAIDVLYKLQQKKIKASLCMIGPDNDGSLYKAKAHAKSLNIEVEFTGKLSKDEWTRRAIEHNIFINTTNFDNMPVSVIEAMALGLPVVSTNVGGIPYLINHNETGVLVPPKNVNAFVDAILDIKNDTNKASNLAIAARNKVEAYDWNNVKSQWKSILK